MSEGKAEPARKEESWGEVVRTVVYALLIAMVLRTFIYEPFMIPSESMLPTLLVGDYVFVNKFAYGYSRHSLPFSPPVMSGRIWEDPVERGDVAVFKLPTDGETDYIKRIVGLPGDRLQVRDGQLYINDEVVTRKFVREVKLYAGTYAAMSASGRIRQAEPQRRYLPVKLYRETLPNGVSYLTLDQGVTSVDNTDIFVVPDRHYFAMGDNRDNSTDSRVLPSVGYVPAENLVGRADIFFFSANDRAEWWEIWGWFEKIRFSRLLRGVGHYADELKVVE